MNLIQGILTLLDSRSFGSAWFWLLFVLVWVLAGRRVLGVPGDILSQVPRRPDPAQGETSALMLLDWLSLTLPRWRIGTSEGPVLWGISAFVVTVLLILGFLYGLEMAQALVLLLLPLLLLFALEARLARKVTAILHRASNGGQEIALAASDAARLMRRHRRLVGFISILAVGVTAYRAALWMITHPFGF